VQLEPAVVGILRPVLLIPQGIEQRLTPEQVSAVLAHERCHVAWRDNLAAAVHILVEALFWFHPLIWWLGKRLVAEREQACDEQVLADGHLPENYAEGILRVCEHYLESSLACAAGVSGANLRQRIEAIMNNRLIERLNGIQKLVMTVAASAAIVVPLAAGVLSAPRAYAQGQAENAAEPDVSAELVRPQFKDADIMNVAQAVSKETGKNFIIDPRLRAQVTMITSVPLSPRAFYEAFQHLLEEYGFKTSEEAGGVIKIVPKANAPEDPGSGPPEQASSASEEFVTGVVNIKNVSAAQLMPVLAPMVSREGHLSVYPSSNILFIFDRASNVNRLIPKIQSLDHAGDRPPT
jgi:hypothetical protein